MKIIFVVVVTIGMIACSDTRESQSPENQQRSVGAVASNRASYTLGLDDVFGWRDHYGDLIGKSKEAAIARFGDGFTEQFPGLLRWSPSARTADRSVDVGMSALDATAKIFLVKVFARDNEGLDPLEILKKAPLFTIETGTYSDSTINFMTATTKDKRNRFQFDVSDSAVTFHAIFFEDPEVAVAIPGGQRR